jgi:hypothetical protein
MDQTWILKNVLHETAYCSMQFGDDIRLAQRVQAGRRPYDREYVLPDAKVLHASGGDLQCSGRTESMT